MQVRRLALGLAVVLSVPALGCGDNRGGLVEGPFGVTVHAPSAALVAVRPTADPADAWHAVALDGDGRAEIAELDGPYAIAIVCDADGFRFVTFEAGPDDPRAWELSCAPARATVDVTIPFDERRRMFIGDQVDRSGIVAVAPGTYDIAMVDRTVEPPRVGIHRGVEIRSERELEFDLGDEPVTMRPVVVDVAGGGASGGVTAVRTAGGTRYETPLGDGARDGYLVPSSALGDGDVQTVLAFARDDRAHGSFLRAARRAVTGDEDAVALELPAAVAPTMWWDPVPHAVYDRRGPWDERVYELAGDGRTWEVHLLPGAGTDELVVPDPTSLPGWDPAWATDHAFDTWSVTLVARPSAEVEQTTAWTGVLDR